MGDGDSLIGTRSEDGHYWWDGTAWQPVEPQASGPTSASTDEALTGFATGSAELTAEHRAVLDRIAGQLNAEPLIMGGYVTLSGQADRVGDGDANRDLGQRRADAVREYLQQQVTDDETKQQIRAYSIGEPDSGPVASDPNLRRVDITITRRGYHVDLGWNHPHEDLGQPYHLPQVTPPPIFLPDPSTPELPPWFWRDLPAHPNHDFVSELSHWLNESLNTDDIARLATDLTPFIDDHQRAELRESLQSAFQSGGEAAIKAVLNEVIRAVAGQPTNPPSSPYGPAIDPIPFPTPQLRTPEIRW